jgi:GTP-binding protein
MYDIAELLIKSGEGGNGCIAFLHDKQTERGGPSGGGGGDGGDVYLYGDASLNTLIKFRYTKVFVAERGQHGRGKTLHGRSGVDCAIAVPLGTVISEIGSSGERLLVGEIITANQKLTVGFGGKGGRGNAAFVSPSNQEPLLSEAGEPGDQSRLFLELKLLADVGIVGKPNAGKSTLLSTISKARPKVAPYPFTTTGPVLGVVETNGVAFTAVEVPGLLEGAHTGHGLGLSFLRHAERTRVLIHLLDGASLDPVKDYEQVTNEMREYAKTLAARRQVVVINKLDLPEVREKAAALCRSLEGYHGRVYAISAATGEGLRDLLGEVVGALASAPAERKDLAPSVPATARRHRGREPQRRLVRLGRKLFRLECLRAERLAATANLRDWRAIAQLRRELDRMGVGRMLEEGGVQDGDTVLLGRVEVTWSWAPPFLKKYSDGDRKH